MVLTSSFPKIFVLLIADIAGSLFIAISFRYTRQLSLGKCKDYACFNCVSDLQIIVHGEAVFLRRLLLTVIPVASKKVSKLITY